MYFLIFLIDIFENLSLSLEAYLKHYGYLHIPLNSKDQNFPPEDVTEALR